MRDLTFEEFSTAWSTYWGRREIGVVLDNSTAARIGSEQRVLRAYYDQWRFALANFPDDTPLWLMGTPDLTPDLFPSRPQDPVGPPPVPRLGRYATPTPGASGLSQGAGDYAVTIPKNSVGARAGRRIARGLPGFFLGVGSLLFIDMPLAALPMAAVGLLWTSQAQWQLRGHRISWRIRLPITAGQVIAVASILLTITLAVPHSPSTPTPDPREINAMTHAIEQ